MTRRRRWTLSGSAVALLLLITACASSGCPDGWDESSGTCAVKSDHVREVRERIGDTGAYGYLGRQGTGLPPTGAGGGFEPAVERGFRLTCISALCTSTSTRTDDKGRWEAALTPGTYCPELGSTPDDGGRPGTSDCFSVVDGALTEVKLSLDF